MIGPGGGDPARILIVDDEPANVLLLERLLRRAGYGELRSTSDPRQVLAQFREYRPDLVLLDLHMPHVDGFSVLRDLSALIPEETYLPVLVLTSDVTRQSRERALSAGAKDFVTKPFDATEVLLRIRNLLQTRKLHLHLEQQLRHAQKMEVIGRLTSGIVHDFSNLLTAIGGNARLLLMDTRPGAPAPMELTEIEAAVQRAISLTRQILAFSRNEEPVEGIHDLNDVVGGLQRTLLRLLGGAVRLEMRLAPSPVRVRADAGQLEQVLMNLVVNARDAMEDGGTVTIATGVEGPRPDGGWWSRLSVSDTGCGMDAPTLSRVFEPYFTTKATGQGTGLGLSIVRGIVERTDGQVEVASAPGRGTTFHVLLPASGDPTPLSPTGRSGGLDELRAGTRSAAARDAR